MCLIIHKPTTNHTVPTHVIEDAMLANSDGFGIIFLDGAEDGTEPEVFFKCGDFSPDYYNKRKVKGIHSYSPALTPKSAPLVPGSSEPNPMYLEDYIAELLHCDRPYLAHLRYATVGTVNTANAHPAPLTPKRDCITGFTGRWQLMTNGTIDGLGDSKVSDTRALAAMLGNVPSKWWPTMLKMTPTRVAIATHRVKDGIREVRRFNKWVESDGVYYSKGDWLLKSTYGSGYGGYGGYGYTKPTPPTVPSTKPKGGAATPTDDDKFSLDHEGFIITNDVDAIAEAIDQPAYLVYELAASLGYDEDELISFTADFSIDEIDHEIRRLISGSGSGYPDSYDYDDDDYCDNYYDSVWGSKSHDLPPMQVGDLVAVYGTLKKGRGNHRLLDGALKAKPLGDGLTTDRFLMECDSTGGSFPYVYDIDPDSLEASTPAAARINVEVYAPLTEQVLADLDALEGVSFGHYTRRKVEVWLTNERRNVVCWMYFAGHQPPLDDSKIMWISKF